MKGQNTSVEVWGRFGMSGTITQEQLRILQEGREESSALLKQLFSDGAFHLDGETYFPDADICLDV